MLVVVSIVSFLQLALLFKGAMLVHVLLKNLAAFDYQKYIMSSGILMLHVTYLFKTDC